MGECLAKIEQGHADAAERGVTFDASTIVADYHKNNSLDELFPFSATRKASSELEQPSSLERNGAPRRGGHIAACLLAARPTTISFRSRPQGGWGASVFASYACGVTRGTPP